MTPTLSPPSSPELLPRITLRDGAEGTLLVGPFASAGHAFAPLAFPKFPQTVLDWTVRFLECLWEEKGVCGAMLLLLDPRSSRWEVLIPRQTCSKEGASWSLAAQRSGGLDPQLVVAGTLQSLPGSGRAGCLADVPPCDGLHGFVQVGGRSPRVTLVLRQGRGLTGVPSAQLVASDTAALLRHYAQRLHLA